MASSSKFFQTFVSHWKNMHKLDGLYLLFSQCKVLEAEPGRVKYEFLVTKDAMNTVGGLHGGATATLLDVCLSGAVFDPETAIDGKQSGITVDMNISFLNSARLGDTIIIEAEKLKKGKSIAFLRGNVYRKDDGKPIAIGMQTLALLDPQKAKM